MRDTLRAVLAPAMISAGILYFTSPQLFNKQCP
jgi:uncharacterized membrane protein